LISATAESSSNSGVSFYTEIDLILNRYFVMFYPSLIGTNICIDEHLIELLSETFSFFYFNLLMFQRELYHERVKTMENFVKCILAISDSFGTLLMARCIKNSSTPLQLFNKVEGYLSLCEEKNRRVLEWNTWGINCFTVVSKSKNHYVLKYETCGVSSFRLHITRGCVKWRVERNFHYDGIPHFNLHGTWNSNKDTTVLWINGTWKWKGDERAEQLAWLEEYREAEEVYVVKRLPRGVVALN